MKKKHHQHLNQFKRDRLQALLENGHKQKDIAKILEVDKSTISREIKRNRRRIRIKGKIRDGPYQATPAQQKARTRRRAAKYQGKKINRNNALRGYILEKLKVFWSPDEISGRMRRERKPFYASKTAIYEWLYSEWGQCFCQYLYSLRYRSRKQKALKTKKTLIPNRKGLELRPKGAKNKTRYSHYEGDTVVSGKKTGSKKALAVIYERKAKYLDTLKIPSLKPLFFNESIKKMAQKVKTMKSFTLDNGIENVHYERLGIPAFFCDPYSAWQKPGVEHGIKMLRWFIPKGSDIGQYSDQYIAQVVKILNGKPRKSLGYKTPYEIMKEHSLLVKQETFQPQLWLEIKKPEVAFRG